MVVRLALTYIIIIKEKQNYYKIFSISFSLLFRKIIYVKPTTIKNQVVTDSVLDLSRCNAIFNIQGICVIKENKIIKNYFIMNV